MIKKISILFFVSFLLIVDFAYSQSGSGGQDGFYPRTRKNFTGSGYSSQNVGAGGFAGNIGDIDGQESNNGVSSEFQFMQIPLESPIDPKTYILGVGDIFDLRLSGRTIKQFNVEVNLQGRVCLPSNDCIKAYGLTLYELDKIIKGIVSKNYKKTKATLFLANPRTVALSITGEVGAPGVYTGRITDRVSKIINMAGGIKLNASKINIYIKRKKERINVNLEDFEFYGNLDANPYIREGDIIVVPSKNGIVKVYGEIKRKGSFEIKKGETLCHLLKERLDGFTSKTSMRENAKILRLLDGKLNRKTYLYDIRKCNQKKRYEFTLKPGDEIYIPTIESMQKVVIVRGAVFGRLNKESATSSNVLGGSAGYETQAILQLGEGETVRDIIFRIGGVTPYAALKKSYIERTRGSKKEIIELDLEKLLIEKDLSYNKPLQPSDVLNIPSKDFAVYVTGSVLTPRLVPYRNEITFPEYLALSGGPTVRADLDDVDLIKKDGRVLDMDDDPTIEPGDIIHVNEVYFKFWQDYLSVILSITSLSFSLMAAF